MAIIISFVFILGLLIGSFLNVCIYRIPEELSIVKPRSRCGNCGTTLESLDLIPVLSYVFLKGKCRYCHQKISVRYPLIEGFTAIIFVLVYLKFGYNMSTLAMWLLSSILIVVMMTDLDHMIIPNKVVIFGLITGMPFALWQIGHPMMMYHSSWSWTGLLGLLGGSGILLLIALISLIIYGGEGGMGMGDVKLFAVIGLYTGLKVSLLALWLSFITGGIIGIILLLIFRKDRKLAIPFGPFIVIGTWLAVFFYDIILGWVF